MVNLEYNAKSFMHHFKKDNNITCERYFKNGVTIKLIEIVVSVSVIMNFLLKFYLTYDFSTVSLLENMNVTFINLRMS